MGGSSSGGDLFNSTNLAAVVDVNRLGQKPADGFEHNLDVYKRRFEAFGWRTEEMYGMTLDEMLEVLCCGWARQSATGHSPQKKLSKGQGFRYPG